MIVARFLPAVLGRCHVDDRTIRPALALVLAIFLGASVPTAIAKEPGSEADRAAIVAAARDYQEAIHRGDVEALAGLWTAEGEYIDVTGQTHDAQAMIQEIGKPAAPANADAVKFTASPLGKLRFITPEVAVEDGTTGAMERPDQTCRYTAIWVKRDGKWRLDSLRESFCEMSPNRHKLASLDWLVGEWVSENDGTVTLVSAYWSEGGHYIVREFLVRAEGREPLSGTERIGFDPATGRIKSWTFDSHGGLGEGFWTLADGKWIVDFKQVMSDGKTASATTSYTPDGIDRFVREVVRADVDGAEVPANRLEFTRASDAP